MDTEFQLDDLFEIAEQVEAKGARFYRQAARACPDADARRLLLGLAKMEEEHEEVFSAIRRQVLGLKSSSGLDPQAAAQYRVVFQTLLVDLEKDLVRRFAGMKTARQFLQKAIDFEKETIVFLTQVTELVARPADRKQVQHLLREELTHVLMLTAEMRERPLRRGTPDFLRPSA